MVEQVGLPDEDLLALLRLEGSYGACFDARDGRAWAELFTEDGAYEGSAFTRLPGEVQHRGHEALATLCRSFPSHIVHVLGLPSFRAEGPDRVSARIGYTSGQCEEQGTSTLSRSTVGYYDVLYRRTPDGWRIQRRRSHALTSSEHRSGGPISPRHAFDGE